MKNYKKYFIIILFAGFFAVALFLIKKRFFGGCAPPLSAEQAAQFIKKQTVNHPSQDLLPPSSPQTGPEPAPVSSALPTKLAALNLMAGVLANKIPLSPLKNFLGSLAEPWAQSLFEEVKLLDHIPSYADLQEHLSPPPSSPKPTSLWDRLKNKMETLISIQKVGDQNVQIHEGMEAIERALYYQDLPKALGLFDSLASEEKISLGSWKKMAQERMRLEELHTRLLLEISKGRE